MRTLFFLFFFCLFNFLVDAQNINPAYNVVFDQDDVHRIDISIDPDTLDWLFDDQNLYSDIYKHADFTFTFRSTNAKTTINNVGFRLRGNTSRQADKKSFKIQFDEFVPGQELDGLDELNLKGSHNDPTLLRERLSFHVLRKMKLPASRVAHVELYINGEYRGLYANVEHIDKRFLRTRFGNDDGNLYKCLYGSNLDDDNDVYDNGVYELKTNRTINDRTELENLINVLNNTPSANFRDAIWNVLDVYDVMNYLAVEAVLGHWDGYAYNKNNFYLYFNTTTQKFQFIPYDPDNTFGIDWVGRDWGTRDVYDWANHGDERPLYNKLLEVDEFYNLFTEYLDELLADYFNENHLYPRIDSLKTMIRPFVVKDNYYPLDYGFNLQDFDDAFTQALGGHVAYGLKPYITTRNSWASSQLDQQALHASFTLQPNQPAVKMIGNELWVEKTLVGETVHLYNTNGQLAFSKFIANTTEKVDVSNGIYILSIPTIGLSQKVMVF